MPKTYFKKAKNPFQITIIIFILFLGLHLQAQPKVAGIEELTLTHLERGYDYIISNQPDLALIEYNKALELNETSHNAYYNIALIYAKSGQQIKAIEICDTALLKCNEDLVSFYLTKANCLSDIDKFEEALPLYHKTLLLEAPESNNNTHYNLGYTYFKLKKWESAILYLNEYLEKGDRENGNYNDALFYTATCYNELKKYNEALTYFDRALEDSTFYSYYFNKAETLMNLNKTDEALAVIDEGLKHNPEKADLYFKKHQIYKVLKQTEKSNEQLKTAYKIDPTDGDILLDMGVMYQQDNQIDLAIKFNHKSIKLKKNISGAYGNLAIIYGDNELRKDSAQYYFQKTLLSDPKNPHHYYNFGNFYKKNKKYDLAIDMYAKSIELDPALIQAYANTSIAYSQKKDPKKAIEFIKKALELDPDDYSNNAYLATLYYDSQDYENTIQYATIALRLKNQDNLEYGLLFKRGVSRQVTGDYKNALYDYLELIKNFTAEEKVERSDVYSNIGYCYMEDNQLEASLKYFKDAVRYKPEIDQLIGLFTVQYLLNNKIESNKTLIRAKTVEPKLKAGYAGIAKLEKEGYFYTDKHKIVLKKILK